MNLCFADSIRDLRPSYLCTNTVNDTDDTEVRSSFLSLYLRSSLPGIQAGPCRANLRDVSFVNSRSKSIITLRISDCGISSIYGLINISNSRISRKNVAEEKDEICTGISQISHCSCCKRFLACIGDGRVTDINGLFMII
jgi:hypothetical protein